MLGLFMDRNAPRYISLTESYLHKLTQYNMSISLPYDNDKCSHPYYYWSLQDNENNALIEFRVACEINDIDIICGLERIVEYDARFSYPADVEDGICAMHLLPNRDSNHSDCGDYYIRSQVNIDFLLYEDAFQIRWGRVEIQRYYCLDNFLLMGLTQHNELASITILKDIRQYIRMDYVEFENSSGIRIYP